MNRFPLWKYAIVLIVALVGALYALPNVFGEAPALQVSSVKATVKVDATTLSRVENKLTTGGLLFDRVYLDGTSVRVRFASTDDQLKAKDALQHEFVPDASDPVYIVALNLVPRSPNWLTALHANPMYLGLDLRGGGAFSLAGGHAGRIDQKDRGVVGRHAHLAA
jgi:preprotein translocase subunit SecD